MLHDTEKAHADWAAVQLVVPTEATDSVLLDVHTHEYIHNIKTHKSKVAQVYIDCISCAFSQALLVSQLYIAALHICPLQAIC